MNLFSPSPAPEIPGERGVSPIGSPPSRTGRLLAVGAMSVGGVLFVLATWSHGGSKKTFATPPPPPRQLQPFEPAKPGPAKAPVPSPPPPLVGLDGRPVPGSGPEVPSLVQEPSGSPQTASGAPSGSSGPQTPAERAAALLQSSERAPLTAYAGGISSSGLSGAALRPVSVAGEAGRPAEGASTSLEALRRGSTIGMARASRLPDRNTLLVAGTSLPCILQTAMDSATPGYVTCLIPSDVFSDNGAVVLLSKGTRVLGEYGSALRQGANRLFVLWTRAVTPEGVAIRLTSPATDSLGRAGVAGVVDTEFWIRFGGALLFSVIGDATAIASSHLASGEFNQTTNVPSQSAGIALSNSIGIPPVLRKNQGSEVSILLAEDLSFAGVYSLSPEPAR